MFIRFGSRLSPQHIGDHSHLNRRMLAAVPLSLITPENLNHRHKAAGSPEGSNELTYWTLDSGGMEGKSWNQRKDNWQIDWRETKASRDERQCKSFSQTLLLFHIYLYNVYKSFEYSSKKLTSGSPLNIRLIGCMKFSPKFKSKLHVPI